jgi:hypothetical protein
MPGAKQERAAVLGALSDVVRFCHLADVGPGRCSRAEAQANPSARPAASNTARRWPTWLTPQPPPTTDFQRPHSSRHNSRRNDDVHDDTP